MFQSSSYSPLADGQVFHNFSLFSSEHEVGNLGHAVDPTPNKPSVSGAFGLGSVDKASSCFGMKKGPETPKPASSLNMDGWFDNISNISCMSEEFKNLESDDGEMQMTNANPKNLRNFTTIDSTGSSCLFTSAKYSRAFGSEPKNEMQWNGTIGMNEDKPTDISLSGSSGGGSLSISLSTSLSISPASELSETALAAVQRTNLQTLGSTTFSASGCKDALVKHGTIHRGNSNKLSCYSRRHPSKTREKQSRKNLIQRSSKNTNPRSCNKQKQSDGVKNMRRPLPVCKQKTLNKETALRTAATRTYKTSRKRYPKTWIGSSCTFEMFTVWLEQNILTHKSMFFAFVTDEEGSRFLQAHLNLATAEQLWSTFNHLKPDFVAISNDVFGNYVAQKYLELGCDELVSAVVETLQSSILSLSMGIYGCRVVQKIFEFAAQKQKPIIAQQFAGSILNFVYDQNGNHVVQKMIQCLNYNEIGFVADEIAGHTLSLAMHPYGSRVIQRVLEKVGMRRARPLLDDIEQHIVALSKNQYGNYIVQWIIDHCSSERRQIFLKLIGHVAELSIEKFASNVIERAFDRSNQAQLRELAEELLRDDNTKKGSYPTLVLLHSDKFGCYVIRTLLQASSGAFRQRLLRCLSKGGKSNKDYGRNVFVKDRQMLPKKTTDVGG